MADITPDNLRGILIPKASLSNENIWIGESSFSQANPRPGIAEPKQLQTDLVISCMGTQSEDIEIKTIQGGSIGQDAGFTWKGKDNLELGKNHSNIINDSKFFLFTTGTPGYINFDCIGTNNGTLFIVSEVVVGTLYNIKIHKQERDGSITEMATLFTGTVASTNTEARPMICQLADGSLLVSYFVYTSQDYINAVVWRSFDNGDTWNQVSSRALIGPYNIFVGINGKLLGKTNLISVNNNVVMVIELISQGPLGGNSGLVWVSRDSGITFNSIQATTTDFHEISVLGLDDGSISVSYISNTREIRHLILSDPGIYMGGDYETAYTTAVSSGVLTFASNVLNSGGGTILDDGSMTSWYQEGKIFIAAKIDTQDIIGFVSSDNGQNWEYIAGGFVPNATSGNIYPHASNNQINRLKSCVWEGFALLLGSTNKSVLGLYLGGYNSFTYPAVVEQPDYYQYLYWVRSWLGHFLPGASSNWNSNGAGSESILSEGLQISTATNIRYYDATFGMNKFQIYRFKIAVDTGSSLLGDYIVFRRIFDDLTNSRTIKIRMATTGFRVYDHAIQLHNENVNMTNPVEFVVSVDDADVKIFWRVWDEKQAKKWNKISLTIGSQASGTGSSLVWGHYALFAGNLNSKWSEFHVGQGGLTIDETNLRDAKYPALGSYIYINEGLNITAKQNPAREGEEYLIPQKFDYPIENIFHQVNSSPRIVWRSADDLAGQVIGMYMDSNIQAAEPSLGVNDLAGLYLGNINFDKFTIQFWDVGTASWNDHLDVDVSEGFVSTFNRVGNTITPNSNTNTFYLAYNEAKDWRVIIGEGENQKVAKVKSNSEGIFSTDYKRAIIVLDSESVDLTTFPTTGNFRLVPNSITITTELLQSLNIGQTGIAIKIPIQPTLEGYFQIGSFIWGSVAFMAPQYQRGRNISYEPNIQSMETLDGAWYARKMSEGRRTFQIAWTEPVDTRNLMSKTPDYWKLSSTVGSQPVANYGDSPFQMLGIWDYLGNRIPAVYLPKIENGIDNQIFNRKHDHAYIRPTGAITIESVLGEELDNEMFRIATITIEEIE